MICVTKTIFIINKTLFCKLCGRIVCGFAIYSSDSVLFRDDLMYRAGLCSKSYFGGSARSVKFSILLQTGGFLCPMAPPCYPYKV